MPREISADPESTGDATQEAADESLLIHFDVAEQSYGVDIGSVREIIRCQPVTRVPSVPDVVEGIIDLRGVVTPIVDLRKRLKVAVTDETDDSRVIVAETADGSVGLLVDRVTGVARLPAGALQPLSSVASSSGADYLEGVAELDGRLIVILNLARALDSESLRAAEWHPPAVEEKTAAPEPAPATDLDEGAAEDGLPLQIELLEQSFEAVKPHATELVAYFYERLFEEHPEVSPLFAQTDMQEQQGKLLSAIATVVANLRHPDVLVPHLQELGRRHVAYGAQPAHYDAVGAVLLEALAHIAGDLWSDELNDAWAEAYGLVASVMMDAAAEVPVAA